MGKIAQLPVPLLHVHKQGNFANYVGGKWNYTKSKIPVQNHPFVILLCVMPVDFTHQGRASSPMRERVKDIQTAGPKNVFTGCFSDIGSVFETLDCTIRIGSTDSICISTLPTHQSAHYVYSKKMVDSSVSSQLK